MAARLTPRLAAALLLLASLAGCFGASDAPEEVTTAETRPPMPQDNATLPDGRGVSAGAVETNRTEPGVGGREHKHDHWRGRDQITLVERDVLLTPLPLFPGGKGSMPQAVGYVTPPPDAQVWEGTEKLTLVVKPPVLFAGAPHPAPPGVTLSFRSAADSEWREPVKLPYGQPLEIPVEPHETDMPHATASLWNFRLVSDRPWAGWDEFNFTLVATRGREVADWPGHPDFYAETDRRVVFESEVTTHQYGIPEDGFYENMQGWVAPDKLISHGTGEVHVFVNVTSFSSTPPVPATRYVLYVHNATEMGLGCCDGEVYRDADGENNLKSYRFIVPVHPDGMDSPYQPGSRWGFHLAAVTGAFTDSTSYDVTYRMTIVAVAAPEPEPLT